MSADDLKRLLSNRRLTLDFETGDQDLSHGLRLVLSDCDTGEMFLLAVEPDSVVMPEENLLFYSLQALETTLPEPPEECLILDLKTRVGPEVEVGDTPLMF